MAQKTVRRNSPQANPRRDIIKRYFPAWVLLGTLFVMFLPQILTVSVHTGAKVMTAIPGMLVEGLEAIGRGALDVVEFAGETVVDVGERIEDWLGGKPAQPEEIAPLFTEQVDYWAKDIARWAADHELDPNLLATVMQIESCGHPTVQSHAGAQGLFQVMPFHFATGEDQLDPDTNALRGADFLKYCLDAANGDPGLAMACYNGGPSVLSQAPSEWYDEPRRYYYWGTGIYVDAQADSATSQRLDEWLNAGGASLCHLADAALAGR